MMGTFCNNRIHKIIKIKKQETRLKKLDIWSVASGKAYKLGLIGGMGEAENGIWFGRNADERLRNGIN